MKLLEAIEELKKIGYVRDVSIDTDEINDGFIHIHLEIDDDLIKEACNELGVMYWEEEDV